MWSQLVVVVVTVVKKMLKVVD